MFYHSVTECDIRYFNACYAIENHNRMLQSNLELEKYWVTHSGYFGLETTVELGMGKKYGKLLLCNGILEGSVENHILIREYYNRTVYDCFNNTFTDGCGIPDLNIYPIDIDDRPHPHKRSRYTPDILLDAISVASEKYVSTLTTRSDSQLVIVLIYNYPNPHHAINKDKHSV